MLHWQTLLKLIVFIFLIDLEYVWLTREPLKLNIIWLILLKLFGILSRNRKWSTLVTISKSFFIQFMFNSLLYSVYFQQKLFERSLKIIIDDILLCNFFGHKTQDLLKNTEWHCNNKTFILMCILMLTKFLRVYIYKNWKMQ